MLTPREVSPVLSRARGPQTPAPSPCTPSPAGRGTLSERKATSPRCIQFQDHLVLETIPPFRIILGLENAAEGSVETLPTTGRENSWFSASSWSPDGRRLAGFRRSVRGSEGISVYSFDSRRYEYFTEFGFFPRWLSDGRRLVFFTFATSSRSAMYLLDTRSRKVREVLSLPPNDISGVAPSRDDRRIYFGVNSVEADVWLMSVE